MVETATYWEIGTGGSQGSIEVENHVELTYGVYLYSKYESSM